MLDRFALKPHSKAPLEEVLPEVQDITEYEESVGLPQEEDLGLRQGRHLVIGCKEAFEARLEEHVRRVGEPGCIPFLPDHATQEIEVEHSWLEAEPVIIPATKQRETQSKSTELG